MAAWPGLGQVATTAAIYLLSKLEMHQVGEFTARDLFELESVEVTDGLLHATRLPRSRLFVWNNPYHGRDIVVFLGEAQPPTGKLALCQRLVATSRALDVSRVFTFSAMITAMAPGAAPRVFGAASDASGLSDLKRHEVAVLHEGRIAGLNGVALSAAGEAGLPAVGLLGEMPALAPQLPFPSASAAVLRVFKELAGLPLDLSELEEYGRSMQGQLASLYERVEEALEIEDPSAHPAPPVPPPTTAPSAPQQGRGPVLSPEEATRVERLFGEAGRERVKAFELKRELDKLGVFPRYEDRFLDLFEPRR